MLSKGIVVLTVFPFSDLTASKRRPALVLSNLNYHQEVVVAFITSKTVHYDVATDFPLPNDHDDFKTSGLKVPSIIKLSKLATLHQEVIQGEMGFLSKESLKLIDEKIKNVFHLI